MQQETIRSGRKRLCDTLSASSGTPFDRRRTHRRGVGAKCTGTSDYTAAYLDDLVIFSNSWEEHLEHLGAVLQHLREAGLTAKPAKCQIGIQQCIYLEYMVGNGEIRSENNKIEALVKFPRPTTKKDVRAFLGSLGYYRKFIPNYASTALPLTDLTKKSLPDRVSWTAACDTAFSELK